MEQVKYNNIIYIFKVTNIYISPTEKIRIQHLSHQPKVIRNFPDFFYSGVSYRITGYNPMGRKVDNDDNIKANLEMRKDINKLHPAVLLASYSEDPESTWREVFIFNKIDIYIIGWIFYSF